MKVMLFYPPNLTSSDSIPHVGYLLFWRVNYPPIALGYLAAYLEQVGHNVKIVDCHILNYGKEDIKREIKSFDPDVVGVTVNTQRVYYAMDIVKIAKEHNPNCLTVFGGPHVTYMSRETLDECPSLDVVIRGEGEITFTELLDKNRQGWEKVRGITFRSNGKIVSTDDRPFIEDLDSLPFPAYHLMPMEKYTVEGYLKKSWINGQRFAGILTSRGCPYNCAFCASKTLGDKWRHNSPKNIIEEIKILIEKFKIQEIEFLDDSFTVSEKRTLEICKLIKKENIDISWFCSTRVDRFTKKIADSISDAGCHAIFFGIESGDQETLNYFNKGFTLKKAEESINITKKAGINAMTFFILGTPIDNKERIKRTIHFSKKLKPKFAIFHQLTPFPGTKVYEMVEEENLLITKDWSKYCTLMSYPVIKIPGISQEELKNLLRKVNLNFYLKPSYIFTVFKEIVATNSLRIINDHIEAILKR